MKDLTKPKVRKELYRKVSFISNEHIHIDEIINLNHVLTPPEIHDLIESHKHFLEQQLNSKIHAIDQVMREYSVDFLSVLDFEEKRRKDHGK